MNADEAKREAVLALAARIKAWNVPDHMPKAQAFIDDMRLRGWLWMPESNRPVPPKKHETCPTHAGSWAHNCTGCAADQHAATPPRRAEDPVPATDAFRRARQQLRMTTTEGDPT